MATQLLLADDSPTIAKILRMALQAEPYEIRAVLTATEAIHELQANPPAIFLVDLSLPEKSGYEFARFIRQDAKLSQVRVVLLASSFEPVDEAEYLACGADGLIKKPFDPSDLRAKLSSVLNALPGAKELDSGGHTDTFSSLVKGNDAQSGGADAILAGILGQGVELDNPPPPAPGKTSEVTNSEQEKTPSVNHELVGSQFTNSTVILDLSGEMDFNSPEEAVLDLSSSFLSPTGDLTPEEMKLISPEAPPPHPPQPALSANAQALSAFFDAEIQFKAESAPKSASPPSAPPPAAAIDSFDASLDSIEWNASPADASLNAWSSNPSKGMPKDSPPPFKPKETKPSFSPKPPTLGASAAPRESAALGGEKLHFDTGGSSFRFSENYINRISKSFSGTTDETIPEVKRAPFFPQKSDDSPAPAAASISAPSAFSGSWSEADSKRIEKIVREEVQMIVREVAEKIAWEVIPELAENLIRKELDKVLKDLEQ